MSKTNITYGVSLLLPLVTLGGLTHFQSLSWTVAFGLSTVLFTTLEYIRIRGNVSECMEELDKFATKIDKVLDEQEETQQRVIAKHAEQLKNIDSKINDLQLKTGQMAGRGVPFRG